MGLWCGGTVATAVTALFAFFIMLMGCQPTAETAQPPPEERNTPGGNSFQVPTASLQTATLTGNASHMLVDGSTDNLFDYLRLDVELTAVESGRVGVLASLLTEDGQLITVGTLDPDPFRSMVASSVHLDAGTQMLSVYFNGNDIRSAGLDHSFKADIGLYDEAGGLMSDLELNIGRLNP